MDERRKIVHFSDLEAWRAARDVVVKTYQLTKRYPREEVFGLVSQMRRAAVSIASNIAEGFGRRTPPEKLRFYDIARGSLIELENQLLISKEVGYLNNEELKSSMDLINRAHQLLNGLSSYIKKNI